MQCVHSKYKTNSSIHAMWWNEMKKVIILITMVVNENQTSLDFEYHYVGFSDI